VVPEISRHFDRHITLACADYLSHKFVDQRWWKERESRIIRVFSWSPALWRRASPLRRGNLVWNCTCMRDLPIGQKGHKAVLCSMVWQPRPRQLAWSPKIKVAPHLLFGMKTGLRNLFLFSSPFFFFPFDSRLLRPLFQTDGPDWIHWRGNSCGEDFGIGRVGCCWVGIELALPWWTVTFSLFCLFVVCFCCFCCFFLFFFGLLFVWLLFVLFVCVLSPFFLRRFLLFSQSNTEVCGYKTQYAVICLPKKS